MSRMQGGIYSQLCRRLLAPLRLFCCTLLLAACQQPEAPPENVESAVAGSTVKSQTVVLREIFNSRQCRATAGGITVIADADRWLEWYRVNTRSLTIGAEPAVAPPVNFDRQQVLIVAMGRQSSAGYSVSLQADQLVVDGPVGNIPVRWKTPPPGSLQAQLLTSPCMAVVSAKLPHISEYRIQINP